MTDLEILEKITWRKEVVKYLEEYCTVKGRPDLFQDVVEHIMELYPEEIYEHTGHYPDDSKAKIEEELIIVGEAFEYLQLHYASSTDLEESDNE